MGGFTAAINQMEKELEQIVKATIESTLGQLGTVGAMAINEFVVRIKAAMSNLAGTEALLTVPGEDVLASLPLTNLTTIAAGPSQTDVSVSRHRISFEPSASGDALTVVPSIIWTPTAVKPCKKLITSCGGFQLIIVVKPLGNVMCYTG